MDVFGVHQQLIADYDAFTSSLVGVRSPEIQRHLEGERERKTRWPDPRISLNPSFRGGGTVAQLADDGVLDRECARYFRRKEHATDPGTRSLTLYRHQREALDAAASHGSYVLTTGTGSGKSLAYILPIVDAVLKNPNPDGISAIVVYPMNALANSQVHELERYLEWGIPEEERRVTFARYTGQEKSDQKSAVLRAKPDILLTNYVMLEYLLTRPEERHELIGAARGLRFLALDELHTYRGRQGADVALLVRRLRDACESPGLQCIGTSATMATARTFEEARTAISKIATQLFGAPVPPEMVIGETLERSTVPGPDLPSRARREALADAVRQAGERPPRLPSGYRALSEDPLAVWIEDSFGLQREQGTDRLVRRVPITVPEAAGALAADSGVPAEDCGPAIEAMLRAGAAVTHPDHGRPLFAFRLHQFLSKGDTVYTSFEPPGERYLTSQYQVSVPEAREKPLIPLAFCRDCGHEYLVVTRERDADGDRLTARRDPDAPAEDGDGYLYAGQERPWPSDPEEIYGRLPDSWVETGDRDRRAVVKARAQDLPREIRVAPDGRIQDPASGQGLRAWWIAAPFRFCLRCRVSYEQLRVSDFVKLATFSAEGRSSAVSLISASIVRSLRGDTELDDRARKLLTFVDNRQDASLQAGHFNDFAQVTQVRGALYRALAAAGPGGLRHDALPEAVAGALGLPLDAFARNPEARHLQRDLAQSALRSVLAYRVYADLERGWRITMPNLSQTGLLRFGYTALHEIAEDPQCWQGAHWALAADTSAHREELARTLLDELRRSLAVDESLLTVDGFDQLVRISDAHLLGVWAIPSREPRVSSRVVFAGPSPKGVRPSDETVHLSGLGAYGRYLRRPGQFAALPALAGKRMSVADADAVIRSLLKVLETEGLVRVAREERDGSLGYQVSTAALCWLPGDGVHPEPDPLRKVNDPGSEPRVNTYFRDLYRVTASGLSGLVAREHTAQVPADLREKREKAFRDGELQLMYCSPTMELGVDIATLNAVGMRNVPPTPANYAQRSGRAGRSGQPALVTTYCSTGSAHDQYYFRRPQLMVSGSVTPPRLDLGNEELLSSHVRAIWLAETGVALGPRLTGLIDAETPAPAPGEQVPLALTRRMRADLDDEAARRRAIVRATEVLAPLVPELAERTRWWHDSWIEDTVRGALGRLDSDCERWRRLYRAALAEADQQHRIVNDLSVDPKKRRRAGFRRAEAEHQQQLLRNEESGEGAFSDFYTYRYFASEGFLPGYSFPRLPLAAYIPGQRAEGRLGQKNGTYIQRPRFIAIGEFGPGALIYHEGHRYAVDRVQVPYGSTPGQVATTDIKVCGSCGYWHDRRHGADLCDSCGTPLTRILSRLMHLSTVYASPRRRISSDEEERLKSGFELRTFYRFNGGTGHRPGELGATAADTTGPTARIIYGDTAAVRVVNLGYRKRKHSADTGFWLNPVEGKWLGAGRAEALAETTSEDEALSPISSAERPLQVIPYVEDHKNIAVFRLAEPVDEITAVTVRYALERGIEAHYQLEDSELSSEDLPDDEGRARMLFVEGAEGGAGVLRLLHDDEHALATVARTALEIIHWDPDTNEDRDRAEGAHERCELGCYDCLLSYTNQRYHTRIDRHAAVEVLRRLAASRTTSDHPVAADPQRAAAELTVRAGHPAGGAFVRWLRETGHRLPDAASAEAADTGVVPDFIYYLPGAEAAVFLDISGAHGLQHDERAGFRLMNSGWLVIRIASDSEKDWEETVRSHPDVFGTGHGAR
ncbi:DEAD/DEAH box helicase [Streptomyces sp. RKAG337]|uniref:DEAD/DEAH box helicase n=1 Tax=Streptomyces sp. RKAG337 TaxID=2893404 RepID=UPI0020349775|nr:DEAD/DEAH box helicase [Streptomyces sp. RKAG337]MCM2429193.1 DEAD/DEAH box helicase [Streptomyces sp. RKAG337]